MKINTVCLTVIASRNLSTLLVSCCMLHSKIQTLNHYYTINSSNKTNFIVNYSDNKVDSFIDKVIHINRTEEFKPGLGGITTRSHAFDDNPQILYSLERFC
jgi:hypothetical protein